MVIFVYHNDLGFSVLKALKRETVLMGKYQKEPVAVFVHVRFTLRVAHKRTHGYYLVYSV